MGAHRFLRRSWIAGPDRDENHLVLYEGGANHFVRGVAAARDQDAVASFLGNKSDELDDIGVGGRTRDRGMELRSLFSH